MFGITATAEAKAFCHMQSMDNKDDVLVDIAGILLGKKTLEEILDEPTTCKFPSQRIAGCLTSSRSCNDGEYCNCSTSTYRHIQNRVKLFCHNRIRKTYYDPSSLLIVRAAVDLHHLTELLKRS